jgi:hypothetical protein
MRHSMQDFSQQMEGNPDRIAILIPGRDLRQLRSAGKLLAPKPPGAVLGDGQEEFTDILGQWRRHKNHDRFLLAEKDKGGWPPRSSGYGQNHMVGPCQNGPVALEDGC